MKKICKVTNSALVSGALLLSLIGITPVHALETGDDSSLKMYQTQIHTFQIHTLMKGF